MAIFLDQQSVKATKYQKIFESVKIFFLLKMRGQFSPWQKARSVFEAILVFFSFKKQRSR